VGAAADRPRTDGARRCRPALNSSDSIESVPNALKNHRQISHDELALEMQHAKAQRPEPRIAASISAEPSGVIGPVDLDDEATGWGEKVDDVLAQHDLPAKRDPELTTRSP
jgi:hypothetical protein